MDVLAQQAMRGHGLTPRQWRQATRAEQVEMLAMAYRRRQDRLALLAEAGERLPGPISQLAQVTIYLADI